MQPRLPSINFQPLSQRGARIGGALLIIIGLLLVSLTGLLFAYFLDLVQVEKLIPGVYRDESAPKGAPLAAWLFVGFFTVFGLVSILQGIWQVVYGARNRVLTIIMILMGGILIFAGLVARALN